MTTWRAAVVVVATMIGTAVVAGPAAAQTQTYRDARGDVTDYFGNPGPRRAGIDVVELRNSYRDGRLSMAMTVRDLPSRWSAVWTIRTGPSSGYGLYVEQRARRTCVFFDRALIGPPGARARPCPPDTSCDAARVRSDKNTVRAVVPARCFGAERRVRIAGSVSDDTRELFDDARRTGMDLSEPNDEFGPFPRRGR